MTAEQLILGFVIGAISMAVLDDVYKCLGRWIRSVRALRKSRQKKVCGHCYTVPCNCVAQAVLRGVMPEAKGR